MQNPSHTYTDIGTYLTTLKAITLEGCVDSVSKPVFVAIPPIASFVESDKFGCGPLNVSFSNNSSALYSSYFWDFGNGITSNIENPNPVIFNTGDNSDSTYYISLNVSNNCGVSEFRDTVTVYHVPISILGLDKNSGCSPLKIHFANSSTGFSNSYLWDFGDGSTSTLVNPNYNIYTTDENDTTYYVSLISYNQCGTDTTTDSIQVHPNTVKSFFNTSPIKGCSPLLINFSNFSTLECIYDWDFGDGNYSNQFNTSHVFMAEDRDTTFTIQLVVNNGCSYDTMSSEIDVFPQPNLSFNVSNDTICSGKDIVFSNTTSNLSNILWEFHDGSFSNLSSITHTYPDGGSFDVFMIGTSRVNGCMDTVSKNVTIISTPDIEINPENTFGCQPFKVDFTNSTLNADFYSWDFGDNNSSGSINPTHTYQNEGSYNGNFVAFNNYGCTDSVVFSIDVYPKPINQFSTSSKACQMPDTLKIINNTEGAIGYLWDFGNGHTSREDNPTTIYDSEGSYDISLISNSLYNCPDTSFYTYVNHGIPEADFSFDYPDLCQPDLVFRNLSLNSNDFYWSFGDGKTSTLKNPKHVYDGFGQSEVTLFAINGSCSDSITQTIEHNYGNPGNIYIPNAFTPNGDGLNDYFEIKTINGNCGYNLSIYNRWGVKIYTSKNLEDYWDGTVNGKQVEMDTYVYVLEGLLIKKVGVVSVIR